ncbi:survival protein sure-like phosphatase/nucleotidase [Rhexocercosporidium sp. MPI-PUGE-AT-0058]|nr:survival protein sure-like phosphatase/nucleotidase [Rhexocercosporidium sp. MPI-PUGE-AT-0058]
MRFSFATIVFLPILAHGSNIIMSNDDGWAEINLRTFYNTLKNAGESPVVSAPAENKSGTGSLDGEADVVEDGCEFNSCPPGSPAVGFNSSDPRLNYVNSFPVTSMAFGISTLSPKFFQGPPDLAVTGPNVGANLDIQVPFSGTVGAAVEAIKTGIPAIAFSGRSGSQTAWTAPTPAYSTIYAQLATNLTTTLLNSGKPYLPEGVWLNVNFPSSSSTSCSEASDVKFVLSRIWPAIPFVDPADVETCGNDRLPLERKVVGEDRCYASVSVGDENKLDADSAAQAVVLKKLSTVLTCLP